MTDEYMARKENKMVELEMSGFIKDDVIAIRRVRDPFGFLGNMSPHSVILVDEEFHTAEAMFQALRFAEDSPRRREIQNEKNPMKAKLLAKKHIDEMVVEPCSEEDVNNMRLVLEIKTLMNFFIAEELQKSGNVLIVEDCTKRQRGNGLFWGAALTEDEEWVGTNMLGKLWMEIRERLQAL